MSLLRTILAELWGLFVDDGSLVIAVMAWVLVTAVCLHNHVIDPGPAAVLLPLGIVVLLAETVIRSARNHGPRP
jgi:hypothetical protein